MRLVVALLLASTAAVVLLFLLVPGPAPTASGDFRVEIIGPGGISIFNGTVHDTNATALSVLMRAAEAGGFEVDLRFGPSCPNSYVAAIAGHGEEGQAGWVYRIGSGGGDLGQAPGESASCCNLRPGDHVRWEWSDEGALGPPCP